MVSSLSNIALNASAAKALLDFHTAERNNCCCEITVLTKQEEKVEFY